MNITYDLFLTDTTMIYEVMSESSNTLRLNNVCEDDVCLICKLAEKYGFTVAAFLGTNEE